MSCTYTVEAASRSNALSPSSTIDEDDSGSLLSNFNTAAAIINTKKKLSLSLKKLKKLSPKSSNSSSNKKSKNGNGGGGDIICNKSVKSRNKNNKKLSIFRFGSSKRNEKYYSALGSDSLQRTEQDITASVDEAEKEEGGKETERRDLGDREIMVQEIIIPKLLNTQASSKLRNGAKTMDDTESVYDSDDDSAVLGIAKPPYIKRKGKSSRSKSRTAKSFIKKSGWANDTRGPFIIDRLESLIHKHTHVTGQNNKETNDAMKVFILLLNVKARQFEFVEVPLSSRISTVEKTLNLATEAATEPVLRSQQYNGLCRPVNGNELSNSQAAGPDECIMRNGELLIALPEDYSAHECTLVGQRIVMMQEVMDIFHRSMPLQDTAKTSTSHSAKHSEEKTSDTEIHLTDSESIGDKTEEFKLDYDEGAVQEIFLDNDDNNIIAKAAATVEQTSNNAENGDLEETSEIYEEIDVAELKQTMSNISEDDFSTLLDSMGVDLDEFLANLKTFTEEEDYEEIEKALCSGVDTVDEGSKSASADVMRSSLTEDLEGGNSCTLMTTLDVVTEEEECQVIETTTSEASSGIDTGNEGSHSTPSVVVLSSVSEDLDGSDTCTLSLPQEMFYQCQDLENAQSVKECNDIAHRQGDIEQDTNNTLAKSVMKSTFPQYVQSILQTMHKIDNSMVEIVSDGIHSLYPKLDIAGLCTLRKRNANIRLSSVLIVKGTKTISFLYILQNAIKTDSVPNPLSDIAPFLMVLTMLVNFQRHYSVNLKSEP